METWSIRRGTDCDAQAVIGIYNHFVYHSFAAYPEQPVDREFFDRLTAEAAQYPFYVVEADEKVVGFALLRPYHWASTFSRAGLLTYFLLPDYAGRGIVAQLLDRLLADAREREIDTVLVHVSSVNEASQRFHRKHGFEECGRFRRVGRKFGQDFDLVWLQRFI